MVELNSPTGWGTVQDPETDERIPLDSDIDDEVAVRLVDHYERLSFEGDGPDIEAAADPEPIEEAEADDPDFSAETFVDRTPMEDVIEDIESGEYDDHLDDIEAMAERDGVLSAIAERRGD